MSDFEERVELYRWLDIGTRFWVKQCVLSNDYFQEDNPAVRRRNMVRYVRLLVREMNRMYSRMVAVLWEHSIDERRRRFREVMNAPMRYSFLIDGAELNESPIWQACEEQLELEEYSSSYPMQYLYHRYEPEYTEQMTEQPLDGPETFEGFIWSAAMADDVDRYMGLTYVHDHLRHTVAINAWRKRVRFLNADFERAVWTPKELLPQPRALRHCNRVAELSSAFAGMVERLSRM